MCAAILAASAIGGAGAQPTPRASLLQLEVADSLGLPLPDATLEVFSLHEGGVYWEWTVAQPGDLPVGTYLLRFSHPGYRSALFSVPLREGSVVSLRVRLDTLVDSTRRERDMQTRPVRAIGLAIEGRVKSDVIGGRRVIDSATIAASGERTLGAVLHRVRDTDLKVLPASGGTFRVGSRFGGCAIPVMVNGDRRQLVAFDVFDRMFSVAEMVAVEIFARPAQIPFAYRGTTSGCGLIVVWFRDP